MGQHNDTLKIMDKLDAFWNSPENQEKYGFTYHHEPDGPHEIYYDGDYDELMKIAYTAAGFNELEIVDDDQHLLLEFEMNDAGNMLVKGTDDLVTVTVEGIGDEPNFVLNFLYYDTPTLLRFNLINPEFYPQDYKCPFMIPLTSLSVLNSYVSQHYQELTDKWNALRPDLPAKPDYLPNYRALNRIRH